MVLRRSLPCHLYGLESISSRVYPDGVSWDVRLWEDVESWVLGLDDETDHLVAAAITRLESEGPRSDDPPLTGSKALEED